MFVEQGLQHVIVFRTNPPARPTVRQLREGLRPRFDVLVRLQRVPGAVAGQHPVGAEWFQGLIAQRPHQGPGKLLVRQGVTSLACINLGLIQRQERVGRMSFRVGGHEQVQLVGPIIFHRRGCQEAEGRDLVGHHGVGV